MSALTSAKGIAFPICRLLLLLSTLPLLHRYPYTHVAISTPSFVGPLGTFRFDCLLICSALGSTFGNFDLWLPIES